MDIALNEEFKQLTLLLDNLAVQKLEGDFSSAEMAYELILAGYRKVKNESSLAK